MEARGECGDDNLSARLVGSCGAWCIWTAQQIVEPRDCVCRGRSMARRASGN